MELTEDRLDYLKAVFTAWAEGTLPESQKLDWCTECGEPQAEFFGQEHITINDPHGRMFVVIGCEGYWQVDPAAVGLDRDGWQSLEDQGIEVQRPAD